MAKRLALVIPTYGRSETVARILEEMVEETYALGVEIYYSDDTPDDSVEAVIRGYSESYSNIYYRRNTPSLGHDCNVIQSIMWPDNDFVWLIGDSLRPKIKELYSITCFLKDQDLIFLNRSINENDVIDNVDSINEYEFVREKLWNQTLTGATIYGRRVREFLAKNEFVKVKNFPHLSLILEFASVSHFVIGWIEKNVIDYLQKPGSYWEDRAIEVFVDDWAQVVTSYPLIVPHSKLVETLQSHSLNTNIFSLKRLIFLRSKNKLNTSTLRRPNFWHVMHLNSTIVHIVARLPKFLAYCMLKFVDIVVWRRQ